MLTFTIFVRPIGRGNFEAYHGTDLLCVSHTPLCDASRVLLERGFAQSRDTIEMWHEGDAYASLRSQIGKAARLTVEETAYGPMLRRTVSKPVKTPIRARNEAPRYTPTYA